MATPSAQDQFELSRLIDQYGHAVHEKDAALWGAVWADRDDCHWDLAGRTMDGKTTIVETWIKAVQAFGWIWHVAPLKWFDVAGDQATGVCYLREEFTRADGVRGTLTARYHDRYVRTEQGWKVLSRRLEVLDRT
jgi:hypothetical protein